MSGWERSLPFLIIALRPYVDATAGLIQTPDSRRLSNGEATDNQAAASRRRTVVIQAFISSPVVSGDRPDWLRTKRTFYPPRGNNFPGSAKCSLSFGCPPGRNGECHALQVG